MADRPRLLSTTPLLVVSNLQQSIIFYCSKLGFREPNAWGEPPCFAMMNRDNFDLMLSLAEKPEYVRPHGVFGVWDMYLRVPDLQAEIAALQAKGVTLARGPEKTFYDMLEIEVVDPDGHRICIGQEVSPGS